MKRALAALRIGRVDDPGFGDRLAALPARARESGAFQHGRRRSSSYRRCSDCEFLSRCHVCPFATSRGTANDGFHADDFGCAFNQVVLKHADRFPRQPNNYEILTGHGHVPRLARQVMGVRADPESPG